MTSAKNWFDPLDHLVIPEFQNFLTKPNQKTCLTIDSTRLMVEILGGMEKEAADEFQHSSYSYRINLDGDYSLVMRYRRETDGLYHPACALGFDATPEGGVLIRQVQGPHGGRVGFRFNSSFRTLEYLLKLLEESFISKGIPVTVDGLPTGIEGAADAHETNEKYSNLRSGIANLNQKYGISTKSRMQKMLEAA